MGRPSKYNEKLALEILKLYSEGASIRSIVRRKSMPSRQTILAWRYAHPEFDKAYKKATEAYTEALVDQALDIVDNGDDPKKSKVQADFRMWLASKLNRRQYGDKLEIEQRVTLDISKALLAATERMKSIGVGTVIDAPVKQLVEAENSDTDTI